MRAAFQTKRVVAIEPLERRALLSGVSMLDAGCVPAGSASGQMPVTAALMAGPSASRASPMGRSASTSASSSSFVYTESNNPSGNSVLAYRRNADDGSLTPLLPGGRGFATGGRGFRSRGDSSRFGPDDTDDEVVASTDGRFLFAVNQGSDTVSEFAIRPNGRLRLLTRFASGGTQPVSLQYDRMHLYVLNRGNSDDTKKATIDANLTIFDVSDAGGVTARAGATIALPAGISPSQLLASPADDLLFVDNFATSSQTAAPSQNTLQAYTIQPDGSLVPSTGGAVAPTGGGLLQGLARNPTAKVIYGGLPSGAVAVFSYDAGGTLTAGETVPAGGGTCWAVVSADGQYLYVTNTGANTVGVYSLADPLKPARLQDFTLRRPTQTGPSSATGAFQLSLDPSGQSLYVVNHGLNDLFQPDNHLHTLAVAGDGTLSEPALPRVFPPARVTARSHPQGLAIVVK